MSELSNFSSEEQELIVSLFYRAGIYVSHAEDEDGEHDDEMEMKALNRVIRALAKNESKSVFLQSVAQAALDKQDKWDEWTNSYFEIEKDCQQVVEILHGTLSKVDFNRYRMSLVKIGEIVASAYGEFGDDMEEEEEGFFSSLVDKMTGGIKSAQDEDAFLNITPAETEAISNVKRALKAPDED